MASTISPTTSTQAERLQERIERHKEEVARLREKYGDPAEALSAFMRQHFDWRALVADEPPGGRPDAFGWEDDDLDAW